MSSIRDCSPGENSSGERVTSGSDGTVIVGIPAFNEGITIGSVVLQSRRYADEVFVVDDGNSDDTVTVAAESGATVIEPGANKGLGQAVRTLLGHVQDINLDAFVLLVGDGQHLPSDIPRVAAPVVEGESDIAIGSRYITNKRTETPAYRRVGQRVFDLLTLESSKTNLTDTQSGFRALSPRVMSKLNLRTDGMGVEGEMIASTVEKELDVKEVSIAVSYEDVDGQRHHPPTRTDGGGVRFATDPRQTPTRVLGPSGGGPVEARRVRVDSHRTPTTVKRYVLAVACSRQWVSRAGWYDRLVLWNRVESDSEHASQ